MTLPDWLTAVPGLGGAPEPLIPSPQTKLQIPLLAAWPDRAFETRLAYLAAIPVQLAEVYHMLNHLPLFISQAASGPPQLMAELRPEALLRPAFDATGRWCAGPMPQTARLLPFLTEASGRIYRLPDRQGPPDLPRDHMLRERLWALLQIQADGLKRMAAALRLLIARGWVVPRAEAQTATLHYIASPDPQALPEIGAQSGNEGYLALRLWAAMALSNRHWRGAAPERAAAQKPDFRQMLGQDAALKHMDFLSQTASIDFSAIQDP